MTYSILLSSKSLQNFMELLALAAIALAFVAPRLAYRPFHALERTLSAFSRRRWHAALAAALFPMIVRVLLLPVFPFPLPRVHDEFSYLLLGDTLAHGRVANPTPPYFKHFETEYELVKPAYASQYEPGQGLFLAAGEVAAGHPWWGVWLSMGILSGVLCWALGFVLPLRWAFFGALLAALQFGIYGYWMNSYFGGAAAAIGGALVFGALTRKPCSPVVCALGLIVLFATRPAEAVLWSAAVIWLGWKNVSRRALVPFLTTFALGATVLAAYNYRITGSPAQPPYSLYREAYGTPQSYWWQPPVVVTRFDHPELARNYQNQLQFWERRYSAAALWDSTWRRARDFWRFFIGPFLTPTLLFLGVLFRHRRLRPWLFVSGIFVLDHATYHAWYPHQSASETVLIVLLLVECWRALRAWQRRRGFGLALSRQLITAFAAAIVLVSAGHALEPLLPPQTSRIWASLFPEPHPRDLAIRRLERYPGKHLVFVHYGPEHPWYDEWVFNGADIPRSRVVFARMCTPESDAALAQAMGDRDVWIADPGRNLLERIEPAQLPIIATRLRSQSAP